MSGCAESPGALAAVVAVADPSLREHALRRFPDDRFAGRFPTGSTRGWVVEAIHEGWLMHYGRPRAFTRMDEDLRLLGGDALFALGLERLTAEGDLEAVAELADLISVSARAVAEGRPEWGEALWRASVERLASPGAGGGAASAFASLARKNQPDRGSARPGEEPSPYP